MSRGRQWGGGGSASAVCSCLFYLNTDFRGPNTIFSPDTPVIPAGSGYAAFLAHTDWPRKRLDPGALHLIKHSTHTLTTPSPHRFRSGNRLTVATVSGGHRVHRVSTATCTPHCPPSSACCLVNTQIWESDRGWWGPDGRGFLTPNKG